MPKLEIPLRSVKYPNLVAIIHSDDYGLVSQYKWSPKPTNHGVVYAVTNIRRGGKKTTITMHDLIMAPPDGMVVDHINGDGLDNDRYENLRFCPSNMQNTWNQKKTRSTVSSQYKGVSWITAKGRWRADLMCDSKKIYLGSYLDEEEASKAYDIGAVHYFGEYARLNHPSLLEWYKTQEVFKDNKTSKYKGVDRMKSGKWRARFRNTHLGLFDTEEEAYLAILSKKEVDSHS